MTKQEKAKDRIFRKVVRPRIRAATGVFTEYLCPNIKRNEMEYLDAVNLDISIVSLHPGNYS